MSDILKIAIVQSEILWHDVAGNFRHFETLILQCNSDVDLVVLPETFSTGFSMEAKNIPAEVLNSAPLWMYEMSVKYQKAICGSAVFFENGNWYNRFFFVHFNEEIEWYNKRKLFTYAKEDESFFAGNESKLITYKNWKIKPLVCYELRFPELSRNTENYDVLLYVANWPERRISHWDKLLPARAIENVCYTIACNRVGKDGNQISYNGHSGAWGFMGNEIIISDKNEILSIEIPKQPLQEWREKFPVLKDI